MSAYKIHRTRYDVLGYAKVCRGLWRFVDLTDGVNSDLPKFIGEFYRTKDELLSDIARYAKMYGCEEDPC